MVLGVTAKTTSTCFILHLWICLFFFSFFYLPHSTELYICFILNASSLNLRKVLLILYNVPLRRCLKKYLLTKCLIWAF